jgi:hypothetical protein
MYHRYNALELIYETTVCAIYLISRRRNAFYHKMKERSSQPKAPYEYVTGAYTNKSKTDY